MGGGGGVSASKLQQLTIQLTSCYQRQATPALAQEIEEKSGVKLLEACAWGLALGLGLGLGFGLGPGLTGRLTLGSGFSCRCACESGTETSESL